MMRPSIALAAVLALAVAGPAQAQARRGPGRGAAPRAASSGRLSIVVNGGMSFLAPAVNQAFSVPINAEGAPIEATLTAGASRFIEGGLRVQIGSSLTVGGVGFYARGTDSAQLVAEIPHPFYFNQPRMVAGDVSDLGRSELGAHVEVGYPLTIGRRSVRLFAGPSWFRVERTLVTGVEYTDAYPFDTATFTGAASAPAVGVAPGFNAGAETSWRVARSASVALLGRYSRAQVTLGGAPGNTAEVTAGGLELGAGVRVGW